MKNTCGHILGEFWCNQCVGDLLKYRDRKIQELDEQFQASTPKHGYGIPPKEYSKSYWFLKYEGKNEWIIGCHPRSIEFNTITEYFGPIPFEVWNGKEESKTLPELFNIARDQLGKDFDIAGKTTLLNVKTFDLLKALSEQLGELKQITKGAGMQ